jgi:dTDP-glucose pyrophosphorylase
MSGPALIVMAAGIGSRYGGLKQIEPYGPNGEIILDYSIYDAKRSGFGKIIFVISREIESVFRKRIDQTIGRFCETAYVYQELDNLPTGFKVPTDRVKPWGTGHAVLSCKHVVESSFAVINADDFYGRSAFKSLAAYLAQTEGKGLPFDYCMVGYQLKNTLTDHGYVSRGICIVDPQGQLEEVRERTHIQKINGQIKYLEKENKWVEIPEHSVTSMNTWGFTPQIFEQLDARFVEFLIKNQEEQATAEFFLPEVINDLLREKRASVKVLSTRERWFGVTYREDAIEVISALQSMVEKGIYPENLWGRIDES